MDGKNKYTKPAIVPEPGSNSGPHGKNRRRRRRHKKNTKPSILEKINSLLISEPISKSDSRKTKRKKTIKKMIELALWSLVIIILLFGLIELFSEVEIKDRRNQSKFRKRSDIIEKRHLYCYSSDPKTQKSNKVPLFLGS